VLCSARRNGFSEIKGIRHTYIRWLWFDVHGGNITEIDSDVSGSREVQLNSDITYQGALAVQRYEDRLISMLWDDPDHVLMQVNRPQNLNGIANSYDTSEAFPRVYRFDLGRKSFESVVGDWTRVSFWSADDRGRVLLGTGLHGLDAVAYVQSDHGYAQRRLPGPRVDSFPNVLGFDASGATAYVAMDAGEGRSAVYAFDSKDLHTARTVFADAEFDIFDGLIQDRVSGEPVAIAYDRDQRAVAWLDERWRAMFETVDHGLPGRFNEPLAWSRSGSVVVLESTSSDASPEYYVYDAAARHLIRIGAAYPEIPSGSFAARRSITYPARDGASIRAYLATPTNRGAQPLPTIVFPHDGPYSRATAAFDYWTAFFVSRGYAVLQPNYRGSTGYGTAFQRAGYEQWGEKMQNDVIDGLDWMIAEGITDPTRVCMVGSGFGGYMALVAAYKTPQKIRCVVSFDGIAELGALTASLSGSRFGERTRARIQRGNAALVANSPFDHVDEIGVPVLMVQSSRDAGRLTLTALDFAQRLQRAGKSVQFVRQPDGDHDLSHTSQRQQLFEAMDAFLHQHLTGSAAPPQD
jgi:dipeptidyl aminopeptidase/acylaminoacyl peptidase